MPDRRLLYATGALRAVATGIVGVELAIYLTLHGLSIGAVGTVVAAGLAGAAVAALVVTLAGDLHGRRRMLTELALIGAAGTAVTALGSGRAVFLAAAFVGMLNGMGRDRGGALILEQAMLPATVDDGRRTRALAWYNVLQDMGHAVGALAAGLPQLLERVAATPAVAGHRAALGLAAALLLASVPLYGRLSPAVEAPRRRPGPRLESRSRKLLLKISALFALDGLGGGFLTTALVSYFFLERFGIGGAALGLLFFSARVMNALSHLVAARLARRIGLVNTMVFTHLPSSLLLMTVPFVPSLPVATALFLLRESLVEMDVPTRQSYVLAVVRPEERTVASGVTNLVRLAMWAIGPALAGLLMERVSLAVPLVAGATLKIAYDLLLYRAFRAVRPPEEETGVTP